MLKANTLPEAGYANGSQGRMIGVVHDDRSYVLPNGSPGEMIMIPPPRFVIMEVHHKGTEERTSLFFPVKSRKQNLSIIATGKSAFTDAGRTVLFLLSH